VQNYFFFDLGERQSPQLALSLINGLFWKFTYNKYKFTTETCCATCTRTRGAHSSVRIAPNTLRSVKRPLTLIEPRRAASNSRVEISKSAIITICIMACHTRRSEIHLAYALRFAGESGKQV
jgi:hypothetical protein